MRTLWIQSLNNSYIRCSSVGYLYHIVLYLSQYLFILLLESESPSVVLDSATPWTIQSMEFSRSEYWSGQPFPFPGDLPNPGIEPRRIVYQLSHKASTYLSYYWKFVAFDHIHLIPFPLPPPASGNHIFDLLFYEFVFQV